MEKAMPNLTRQQSLLLQAVSDNKIPLVKAILEIPGIDVNFIASEFTKQTLLHIAAEAKNVEMVNILLERHISLNDIDAMGNTPLSIAAGTGQLTIAQALLTAGADVNASGTIENEYLPRITGLTALHSAALKGNVPMMELLLSNGADINAVKTQVKNPGVGQQPGGRFFKASNRSNQETPLDLAHRQGHTEAETFLKASAAESALGQNPGCSIM